MAPSLCCHIFSSRCGTGGLEPTNSSTATKANGMQVLDPTGPCTPFIDHSWKFTKNTFHDWPVKFHAVQNMLHMLLDSHASLINGVQVLDPPDPCTPHCTNHAAHSPNRPCVTTHLRLKHCAGLGKEPESPLTLEFVQCQPQAAL